jgi:hypothetical protein
LKQGVPPPQETRGDRCAGVAASGLSEPRRDLCIVRFGESTPLPNCRTGLLGKLDAALAVMYSIINLIDAYAALLLKRIDPVIVDI